MSAEENEPTESAEEGTKKAASKHSLRGPTVRHLRGLGHHLHPVVQIGKEGVTDALFLAVREALLRHELIKVKILQEAPVDRHDAAGEISEATGSMLIQVLGRTILLYKHHPKKPRIELPKTRKAATALAKGEAKTKKKRVNRRKKKRVPRAVE